MGGNERRTSNEGMELTRLTSHDVMRTRAGGSATVLDPWAKRGTLSREVAGAGRCLDVADALGLAPELRDGRSFRRGMSEGTYRLVLHTHGTERTGWGAYIESWGWSQDHGRVPPTKVLHRFNSSKRVKGATAAASLAALEAELRALMRAHPETPPTRHEPDRE
jgi:hypothetical protein